MKRILLVVMSGLLVFLCACQSPLAVIATPAPTAAMTAAPDATPTADPTPTAAPDPTPTPTPAPVRITVMAVGDVMCLGAQLNAAHGGGGYNFDYAFAEVKDILSSADLAIGNLETLIADGHPYTAIASDDDEEPTPTPGDGTEPTPSDSTTPSESAPVPETSENGGEPTQAAFGPGSVMADVALQHETWSSCQPLLDSPRINGPESFLSAVVGAGFDVLTNANNHIFDYGVDGIKKTLERLDSYGIPHTGAYTSEEEKAPLIVEVQGIKIGIVAYTDHVNRGGNKALMNLYDADAVAADIAAVKEAGADFTIVYMHWGTENTHSVNRKQRNIAQHIADSGADLILGSHPHCLQEFELLDTEDGQVPVIYSLGNFVSSMASRSMNRDGMILKFVLEKDIVTGETTLEPMSYMPTYCMNTDAGGFTVLPADLASIAQSEYASKLESSRSRTIDVLGEEIATPE